MNPSELLKLDMEFQDVMFASCLLLLLHQIFLCYVFIIFLGNENIYYMTVYIESVYFLFQALEVKDCPESQKGLDFGILNC